MERIKIGSPEKTPQISLKVKEKIGKITSDLAASADVADASESEKVNLSEKFNVDPSEYPIFSRQAGRRIDELTGKSEVRTLSINETLGKMVGATANVISTIDGEQGCPKADHVIYLDKSARPVSWLVDDFWHDFSDNEQPSKSFLAIDRRPWFQKVGIDITAREELKDQDDSLRPATGEDFWAAYEKAPEEKKLEWSARIRSLYIEGGIESQDPEKIMATPTVLDGKNLLIVDEVSRSGATLDIAKGLLKRAIPELESVSGCVFWNDTLSKTEAGTQMGKTPVWYPEDPADWRGRGVRDIDENYYKKIYLEHPSKETRAQYYGAFVLGVPLTDKSEEPGQLSWKLRDEMRKMHVDYENGRILPALPIGENHASSSSVALEKMMDHLEQEGVEFVPENQAKNNPNSYAALTKIRDKKPRY